MFIGLRDPAPVWPDLNQSNQRVYRILAGIL
ncbi:Uncharacterised protein [Bordetella pertussis]|nr:Uncharacterised protein [Bordetella pertussis]